MVDVDTIDFPSKFYFNNDNLKIREYIRAFDTAKATGNNVFFFRSYKIMLSELADRKRMSRGR